MANPNIFQQFMQPVKSVSDYTADMDRADSNRLSLDSQRNQNALQALTMQQTQGQISDNAAKRNAIQQIYASNPTADPLSRARALQNNPLTAADGVAAEKALLDNDQTRAGTAKDQSAIDAQKADIKWKLADRHVQQLSAVQTPQDAMSWIDEGIREGSLPAAGRDRSLQMLQQNFEGWKQAVQNGAIPVLEKFKTDAEMARAKLSSDTSITTTRMNNDTSRSTNAATGAVAMRGQNMTDGRARETNALTREGQQTQVINDPTQGILLVNKGTGLVRPGVGINGQPVTADSVAKKQASAKNTLGILDEADKLIGQSTGSYLGAAADTVAQTFGGATEGAKATAKLKVLEGGLMMAQPRMEGPQSDKDTMLYRQMAGQIGDPTVPREIKKAALGTIRGLQQKYVGGTQSDGMPSDIADIMRKHGGK